MLSFLLVIPILATGLDSKEGGPQLANPVARTLIAEGLEIEGKSISFPPPLLHDGQTAEEQTKILRDLLESDRKVAEFLRDSVSAPFILKLKDESTTGSLVRNADLWFAVHANLDDINLDDLSRQAKEPKPIEVGNMRFESRLLTPSELEARGIAVAKEDTSTKTFFIHQTGRLLDRIHVEGTDQVVATRSANSWVFATKTDPRFDEDPKSGNRWWTITRRGKEEQAGQAQKFAGGGSYITITRLAADPKVLVAEAHFRFAEPRGWFDGAPILRSKLSLIAQDQIRQLRREVASRKARAEPAKP